MTGLFRCGKCGETRKFNAYGRLHRELFLITPGAVILQGESFIVNRRDRERWDTRCTPCLLHRTRKGDRLTQPIRAG